MVKNLFKNLSIRLIHFIELLNLRQAGQKKKLILAVPLKNGVLSTNVFVKPTDAHQFLDPFFCQPYHFKKGIRNSQTLRLNRICSDNTNFEKSFICFLS